MQLDELINWLTTVVDSLAIQEQYKDEVYKAAFEHIADTLIVSGLSAMKHFRAHVGFQECLTGRDIDMINENAISNILIDVDYLEDALKRIDRSHLVTVFVELRAVSTGKFLIKLNADILIWTR